MTPTSRHRLVSPLLATLTLLAACSDTTAPVAPSSPSAAKAKPPVSTERIAFVRKTATGGAQLWTVRPDGTFPTPFGDEHYSASFPTWSPDGTKLAVVVVGIPIPGFSNTGINIYDAATGAVIDGISTLFRGPDRNLAWTPDGTSLVYTDGGAVLEMATSGSDLSTPVCNELYSTGSAAEAVPSPSGDRWAVIREKAGEPDRLYVMDPVACTQTEVVLPPGHLSGVTWSPSGRQLAFASSMTEDFEIYTVETTGAKRVRLTFSDGDDLEPAFSPDGKKLDFQSKRGGSAEPRLFRMNADGTGLLPLGSNPLGDAEPAWSR